MQYRQARKLHNGDEVTLKAGKKPVCTVLTATDHADHADPEGKPFPFVEIELTGPAGYLKVTHLEVT